MRRLMSGFLMALVLSVGLHAAVQQRASDGPIVIVTDPITGETVIVPWCEINPWDILCWFWPSQLVVEK